MNEAFERGAVKESLYVVVTNLFVDVAAVAAAVLQQVFACGGQMCFVELEDLVAERMGFCRRRGVLLAHGRLQ